MQLSFAVEKCNKITYVNTWKFNSTRTTVIPFSPSLSASPSPPHTPFSACLQHLLVRSTLRFNLNKFQLDFPTICSHFVAHFFLSFTFSPSLSLSFPCTFFCTFGNIYGQKVPFARLVACWSCCWCWCWCCCFSHFPQFFDAAFSLCVPSSVSRVRQRVQVLSVSVRSIGGHVRAGTALGHYYTSTRKGGVAEAEAAAAWVVCQPGGRHVKL